MTKAFLPTGKIQDWDCFMADFGTRPIIHDDEIRFYYSGSNVHHDWWMFGEMEGLDVPEIYVSGCSMSLPAEVQRQVIGSRPGLERAVMGGCSGGPLQRVKRRQ